MSISFTVRQGQFLAFIHGFIVKHGVGPSFEEIGAHFGTTPPSVNGMIKTLERRRLLGRVRGVARSLRVLVPPSELPQGEFGLRASRAAPSRQGQPSQAPGTSVADAAGSVAIAVLDAVMPHWLAGAGVPGDDLVMEAAHAVRSSLTSMGFDERAAVAVAKRVLAEASRWSPEGRGTVVRRRRWTKR
jgi:hypothetical protein